MTCSYCQAYLAAYQTYVRAFLAEEERYLAAVTGRNQSKHVYHLVPVPLSNGGIQYKDKNGDGCLKMIPQSNGEYSYIGTEDVIQRLLGRSELDRAGPKLRDGLFSND